VGTATGSMTVWLYDVVDVTGPITPSGPTVAVNLTTPGQNARLTFSGTAGQRVSALFAPTSGTFYCNGTLAILNPDNTTAGSVGFCGGSGFLEPVTLPVTGTYPLPVDLYMHRTGSSTVKLYKVVDVTGPITPSGP